MIKFSLWQILLVVAKKNILWTSNCDFKFHKLKIANFTALNKIYKKDSKILQILCLTLECSMLKNCQIGVFCENQNITSGTTRTFLIRSLRPVVNFTNILYAHLRRYFFAKRISNLKCKYKKASRKTFVRCQFH